MFVQRCARRRVLTLVLSTAYPTCFPLTQFTCNNGRCININWRCDNGECLFSSSALSVPVSIGYLSLSFVPVCRACVATSAYTLLFVTLYIFCVFFFYCCSTTPFSLLSFVALHCGFDVLGCWFCSVLCSSPTLLSPVGSVFQKRIVGTALMS